LISPMVSIPYSSGEFINVLLHEIAHYIAFTMFQSLIHQGNSSTRY